MKSTATTPRLRATRAALAAVLAAVTLLSGVGCGQSGPLFLPAAEPAAPAATPPAEQPAQGESGETVTTDREAEEDRSEKTPRA